MTSQPTFQKTIDVCDRWQEAATIEVIMSITEQTNSENKTAARFLRPVICNFIPEEETELSYRNKTYVIFDGDEDMWAYGFMRGWKANENIDFNFFDAHDLKPLTKRAGVSTVKRRLRERLANTKQALILVGEKTKNLYRFVRWEIETCQTLDIPIIAVNLNGKRTQDNDLCPPIIRDTYVVHVPFKLKIIQYALDHFPDRYHRRKPQDSGPRIYNNSVYKKLGL